MKNNIGYTKIAAEMCGISPGTVSMYVNQYKAPKPANCFYLWFLCHKKRIKDRHAAVLKRAPLTKVKARKKENKKRMNRYRSDPEHRAMVLARNRRNYKNIDPAKLKNRSIRANRKARSSPQGKIAYTCRARLHKVLKSQGRIKQGRMIDMVGCSWDMLKIHLESQFTKSMNWDNHGTHWHIDHIQPMASFDLSDKNQVKIACNYLNLKPVLKFKNLSKGSKVTEPQLHLPLSLL